MQPAAGFTLLEILVVLALMAAMTALVLPQLSRLYESGQRSVTRSQVLDSLAGLPHEAFVRQQGFTLKALPGQEDVPLDLPSGWSIKAASEAGITYRDSGFCNGGSLVLGNEDYSEELVLRAPFCEPLAR